MKKRKKILSDHSGMTLVEIGGEEFVESGSYVEETVKDSDRPVTGFWADQAVMEEIFADGE